MSKTLIRVSFQLLYLMGGSNQFNAAQQHFTVKNISLVKTSMDQAQLWWVVTMPDRYITSEMQCCVNSCITFVLDCERLSLAMNSDQNLCFWAHQSCNSKWLTLTSGHWQKFLLLPYCEEIEASSVPQRAWPAIIYDLLYLHMSSAYICHLEC